VDVVIVGGGVSGSYTAWRLRDHNLRIHVFEASGRVGGALYTHTFPGVPPIPVELGASAYSPSVMPRG
jgi:protoporphyrinogen oxidase